MPLSLFNVLFLDLKAQQALQEQQARARGLDLASFDVSL